MGDRVNERLEYRPVAVLRSLDAGGPLRGPDGHVPAHEMQRFGDLAIERAGEIGSVPLVVDVSPLACVTNGLDVCVWEPLSR